MTSGYVFAKADELNAQVFVSRTVVAGVGQWNCSISVNREGAHVEGLPHRFSSDAKGTTMEQAVLAAARGLSEFKS